MNLCSEGHDEVCYEGNNCPACEMKEDRNYFEEEVSKRDEQIEKLENEIIELENKE
jgi:hypothetical protein